MSINLGYVRGNVSNHQDYVIFSEVHSQSLEKINVACCATKFEKNNFWDKGKIRQRSYVDIEDIISGEFDILDVSEFYRDYSQSILSKFNGKKSVTVFDNLPFGISGGNAGALSANADLIIARTAMIKNMLLLEGVPDEKIQIIPSAVDTTYFKPGINTGNNNIVLFCGRLAPEKGLWDLIVAMTGLKAELHVAGEGDIRPYQTLASKCKVNMKYHGKIEYSGLASFYRSGSILVVPSIPKIDAYNPANSWVEQFGMVILEGMSTGLPVICSDTGSARDIFGVTKAGLLFPPRAWDILRDQIVMLLNNSAMRNELGGKALRRANSTFSTLNVGRLLAEAYSEL